MEPNGRRLAPVKGRDGVYGWMMEEEEVWRQRNTFAPDYRVDYRPQEAPPLAEDERKEEKSLAYLSSHGGRQRLKVLLAVRRESHCGCGIVYVWITE